MQTEEKKAQGTVVLVRTYNAPVHRVWKALTDKDQMKIWYFDIAEFKPEVGFEFQFEGGKDEKRYLHLCRVTEVIPEKKLQYTWRYEGYSGESLLTIELTPEDNRTRLKLTHEGLHTFPSDVHDLDPCNFTEGWNQLMNISLKNHIEKAFIKKTINIHASGKRIWEVLQDPSINIKWAKAFYEGTYVETDWQEGSVISWKVAGEIGAKGVIKQNIPGSLLKIDYFDDVNMSPPHPIGEYSEVFAVHEDDNQSTLMTVSGPLSLLDIASQEPLWEKGIVLIKELAESIR